MKIYLKHNEYCVHVRKRLSVQADALSFKTLCSLSLLDCADLQGAVVPERFLYVLNPSISLCPGKKYIRMKLKRPTGAKMWEEDKLLSNNLWE